MKDPREYDATYLDAVSEFLTAAEFAAFVEAEDEAMEEAARYEVVVDDVVVSRHFTEPLADLEAQVASHVQAILGHYTHNGTPLHGEVRVQEREVA